MVDITIDVPDILQSDKFKTIFQKHLTIAKKTIIDRLQYAAKESHRYKHQTRNLRNATSVKDKTNESELLNVTVGVNQSKAPYAKYVINGHGSWNGDPFIDKAVNDNRSFIEQTINSAISDAIDEINR